MPTNAKVFIQYGPYEACGVVEHRTSRLEGLQTVLKEDGHQVELVQIKDRDVVQLMVNGEEVFKCDINQLDYGSDGELDRLCGEALDKVRRAY